MRAENDEPDVVEWDKVVDVVGEVVSIPLVGGLHHRYTRRAA